MASQKYSSSRAIASGVGNISGTGCVLVSAEIRLCFPPALQELCMHCCSQVVAFSRGSTSCSGGGVLVADEAKMA